jgi:hypothetical protein
MVEQVAAASNCLVMVERFLGGKEYCIAVMGGGSAGAVAFSAVERHLEEDEKVSDICYHCYKWLVGKHRTFESSWESEVLCSNRRPSC